MLGIIIVQLLSIKKQRLVPGHCLQLKVLLEKKKDDVTYKMLEFYKQISDVYINKGT